MLVDFTSMSKQHRTTPEEPEEMPARVEKPEITEPADPKTREVPEEAPDEIPPEITPDKDGDDGEGGIVHPG